MVNTDVMVAMYTQISFNDYLISRRDELVELWGEWRDAQVDSDTHRELVDSTFTEVLHSLDKLIADTIEF